MEKTKKGGKSALGEKITALARQRGYAKPSDFAHDHEITLSTFNDLIYGKTKILPDSLVKVSKALGVEPWELIRPSIDQAKHSVAGKESESEFDDGLVGLDSKLPRKNSAKAHDRKARNAEHDLVENIHTISSDIATQVITALKSENKQETMRLQAEIDQLKAELSAKQAPKPAVTGVANYDSLPEEHRELIAAVPRIDKQMARSILKNILVEFPLPDETEDRRRS